MSEHWEAYRRGEITYEEYARIKMLIWRRNNKERLREQRWAKGFTGAREFADRQRKKRYIQATPKWLTVGNYRVMNAMYDFARSWSEKTGILHHVDHISPIAGEHSCGLHVPWNLQVTTQAENDSKGNKVSLVKRPCLLTTANNLLPMERPNGESDECLHDLSGYGQP